MSIPVNLPPLLPELYIAVALFIKANAIRGTTT